MTPPDAQTAAAALGAAAIVDIWMGGDQSWRVRMDDSLFLESAGWLTAVELSTAVLAATGSVTNGQTAAADLAAAVVEFGERLPGWVWVAANALDGRGRASTLHFRATAATPAAALRAVMQQALDAKGERG